VLNHSKAPREVLDVVRKILGSSFTVSVYKATVSLGMLGLLTFVWNL